MNLTRAADLTPGAHVLGIDRGPVVKVEFREGRVRLTFHVGDEVLHVVKEAGEMVAVRDA